MTDLGKLLLVLGGVIVLTGAVLLLAGRFNVPLGRLPGDIVYRGKNTVLLLSSGHLHCRQHRAVTAFLVVWARTQVTALLTSRFKPSEPRRAAVRAFPATVSRGQSTL